MDDVLTSAAVVLREYRSYMDIAHQAWQTIDAMGFRNMAEAFDPTFLVDWIRMPGFPAPKKADLVPTPHEVLKNDPSYKLVWLPYPACSEDGEFYPTLICGELFNEVHSCGINLTVFEATIMANYCLPPTYIRVPEVYDKEHEYFTRVMYRPNMTKARFSYAETLDEYFVERDIPMANEKWFRRPKYGEVIEMFRQYLMKSVSEFRKEKPGPGPDYRTNFQEWLAAQHACGDVLDIILYTGALDDVPTAKPVSQRTMMHYVMEQWLNRPEDFKEKGSFLKLIDLEGIDARKEKDAKILVEQSRLGGVYA